MILKYKSVDFHLSIRDSKSKSGLGAGDYWCILDIDVYNKEINFKASWEAISYYEIKDLLKELKEFMNDNTIKRKRISFIKNYFLIYLSTKKKSKKELQLKLIHIDSLKSNYVIVFEQDEILSFIHSIELYCNKINT